MNSTKSEILKSVVAKLTQFHLLNRRLFFLKKKELSLYARVFLLSNFLMCSGYFVSF